MRVRCMAARPVFHLASKPYQPISMFDVDDAVHVVLRMRNYQDRVDYCASVGLDYDRIWEYYEVVCSLERKIRKKDSRAKRK